MKANGNIMLQRLKESVASQSGCSLVYIKMLKSDLGRVLKGYMDFADIDIDVCEMEGGHQLTVSVSVLDFLDIGHGQ